MLRSFRLGTIGLTGFAISSSLQAQFASGDPASNASGGFIIRAPRKHPHQPSRNNTFSMTIGDTADPFLSGRRVVGQAMPESPPYSSSCFKCISSFANIADSQKTALHGGSI